MDNITREELFLQAAASGDATGLPAPVMREEMYLYIKAKGDTTGILEPITRREMFWHAMCVGSTDGLPDPVTREEVFLYAAAAGETEGLPEPVTRTELYLKAIAESGGGGDDDGGDKPFAELTWEQVVASTKTGKYKTFSVGATKQLDLGTEGIVNMQIAAIDTDDLADGSGKAPLTLLSVEILLTSRAMNPALSPSSAPYTEGTGTIGGYEKCEMRTYLADTIKPLIPRPVRNSLKPVKKYSTGYNAAGQKQTNVVTTEDVWIPSGREAFGGTTYESSGPVYSGVFPDQASRKKAKADDPKIITWWLRSANSTGNFACTSAIGSQYYGGAIGERGVVLGFCL